MSNSTWVRPNGERDEIRDVLSSIIHHQIGKNLNRLLKVLANFGRRGGEWNSSEIPPLWLTSTSNTAGATRGWIIPITKNQTHAESSLSRGEWSWERYQETLKDLGTHPSLNELGISEVQDETVVWAKDKLCNVTGEENRIQSLITVTHVDNVIQRRPQTIWPVQRIPSFNRNRNILLNCAWSRTKKKIFPIILCGENHAYTGIWQR